MMQIHLLFMGIPLVVAGALAAIFLPRKGPHPDTYVLPEPWTHAPILWAAVGESVGRHSGHGEHSEVAIGGGASGTW